MIDRRLAAIGLSLICGYLLLLARFSLDAYFTPDDCMNLYRSWIYPTAALVKANLLFLMASPFQRPLGSVFYAAIFHFAGFHPRWFHVASLAFLAANIPLTYAVARRLSGSRLAATLTALLACYEGKFTSLYFDTGFIYDVLCYFFTLAALLAYLCSRQGGERVRWREAAAIAVLFICALNSKEMAVMLPLFMLAYEALYHPPRVYSRSAIAKWLWSECKVPLSLCLVSVLFVIGRSVGPDTLIADVAYRPVFTWVRFMQTSRGFLDALFAVDHFFTTGLTLWFWGVTAAAAWFSRSRALWFAWLFAMAGVAPVAFLPPRGGPQYFVPLFGWSLYAGVALAKLAQRLPRFLGRKIPFWGERAGAGGLVACFAGFLCLHYHALGLAGLTPVTVEAPMVHSIADQLHRLYPVIPHGARILFLNDPYPANWENMIFVTRLSYGDDSLIVKRVKQMKQAPGEAEAGSYNVVVDYRAGRFMNATVQAQPATYPPSLVVVPAAKGEGVADAYHGADWEPVTETNPARPGERIMLKAADLGATNPATAAGQPFPQDPLARVIAAINARVNGRAASVEEKLGWPGESNLYRVDIRLPRETEAGLARISLVENGAELPVALLWVKR